MAIADLFQKSQAFASANSSSILTGLAITGTVTTAYLSGRASFKALELIIDQENRTGTPGTKKERVKERTALVWPLYVPAIGTGALTIGTIVYAHRLSSRQAAALTAAYGISERAFAEYKEKVIEKIGANKELAVRDEIAQDRISNNPVKSEEVIIIGTGDVLCFDTITGRYFMSNMQTLKKAENNLNYTILNHMYASLSSLYDDMGLTATEYSNEVGWSSLTSPMSLVFSTVMSTDDRPCISVDYVPSPRPNYAQLY